MTTKNGKARSKAAGKLMEIAGLLVRPYDKLLDLEMNTNGDDAKEFEEMGCKLQSVHARLCALAANLDLLGVEDD